MREENVDTENGTHKYPPTLIQKPFMLRRTISGGELGGGGGANLQRADGQCGHEYGEERSDEEDLTFCHHDREEQEPQKSEKRGGTWVEALFSQVSIV